VTVGRWRVDHEEEALLSGWKLGDIMLGVCAANVLLHRSISLLLHVKRIQLKTHDLCL
jgi:hypothetical protein